MPANTPRGFPYILPADHPLEYPVVSQQLAESIDARGLLAANAIKASDQTGIASGGSAGITATLSGLRIGAKVLAVMQMQMAATAGSAPVNLFVSPLSLTGADVIGTMQENRTTAQALNQFMQVMAVYLLSATAESVSLGMKGVTGSGGAWTCAKGSSITLVSL